jgi:hypothetical protein
MEGNQGREVAAMLNQVGKKIVEMMGTGKDGARRSARAAQIGLEIMSLESLHVELMLELGEAFYDAAAKTGKARARAQAYLAALVARVRELEKKVASLKRAMKNPAPEGTGKRRGRPPKAKAEKAAKKKPGRRGRPPKAKAEKVAKKKPGRRGRPPKAKAAKVAKAAKKPAKGNKAAKKSGARRGRPPKGKGAVKAPASVAPKGAAAAGKPAPATETPAA